MRGEQELAAHDPGGLEVLTSSAEAVRRGADARESHAEARAHRSAPAERHRQRVLGRDPARREDVADAADEQADAASRSNSLHAHTIGILTKWRDELIAETGEKFPEKVTAFRDGMAAHGRYGKPCPVCGTAIQRIQYATNEANYCPTCQTGGKLLADRGLSRLLKDDWPKSLEELERFEGSSAEANG